jgi:hypothetical protein
MSIPQRPDGFEDLPKRFKKYVDVIESKLSAYESDRASQQISRVKIASLGRLFGNTEEHLRHSAKVGFCLAPDGAEIGSSQDWVKAYLQQDAAGNYVVEIYGENGQLLVKPATSNVIQIAMTHFGKVIL